MNKLKNHTIYFSLSLLCLFIPGGALLLMGRRYFSFLIPIIGLVWVAIISWNRWVLSTTGFSTLLIGLAILHITSFCWGIRLANKQYTQLHSKKHVLFILLVLLNGFITFSCHQYKSMWFGFSFYYIPSASMYPTLKTGDVSLVDTWAYNKETPNKNDILVFRRSPESNVLVKRLTRTKQK